jgi:parallel beta-helix repeat protein
MDRLVRGFVLTAVVSVLLAIVFTTSALAATKYVGTSGTDSLVSPNGEAAATPWKTFHFAVSNLAAGDTLIVLPGTYDLTHEGVDSAISVTVSNVTIQGQSAGTAIIDGIGALTWVSGLNISGNDVVIHKLVFKRFQTSGINISAGTGTDINQNIVFDNGTSGSAGTGIYLSSVVSCQIRDNTVYWSGDTNYRQGTGISAAFGVGNTTNVQFNTVYNHNVTGYLGISISGGSTPNVTQNILYDNDTGIYSSDSNPNISLNELYDNKTGIQVNASASSFANVWNNLIYDTSGGLDTGILVQMLSAGTMVPAIYHNTIDGGAFFGIRVENTGANPDIRYNMITNFSAGAGISNIGGGAPTMRYNNIFGCGTSYSGTTAGTGDANLAPGYVGGTDYHLTASSPCLDLVPAGESDIVSADFEGVPRPAGEPRDPGCYEYATPVNSVSVTFPPGVTADKFICASVPLNLSDPSVIGTLGPQIGTYDTKLMRIGHWEPDLPGYMEYPGNDDDTMYPGDGIWYLFRNGATIVFSGSPVSTTPDPKDGVQSYYIPLKVGWNQIGNPFTHPVAISNMVVSNNDGTPGAEDLTTGTLTQGIFWVYQDGAYYAASKLPVAGGGWILKLSEEGKLWVKNVSVAYPDMTSAPSKFDQGLYPVSDHYDRPPAPPGDINGGWSSSGGGGGGGGCFILSSRD